MTGLTKKYKEYLNDSYSPIDVNITRVRWYAGDAWVCEKEMRPDFAIDQRREINIFNSQHKGFCPLA